MAPKKKGAGKKKSQAGRLSWMSDEFYALTQNLVGLCEAFKGTPMEPKISKQQVNCSDPACFLCVGVGAVRADWLLCDSNQKAQHRITLCAAPPHPSLSSCHTHLTDPRASPAPLCLW
jgi:hypothetical protein